MLIQSAVEGATSPAAASPTSVQRATASDDDDGASSQTEEAAAPTPATETKPPNSFARPLNVLNELDRRLDTPDSQTFLLTDAEALSATQEDIEATDDKTAVLACTVPPETTQPQGNDEDTDTVISDTARLNSRFDGYTDALDAWKADQLAAFDAAAGKGEDAQPGDSAGRHALLWTEKWASNAAGGLLRVVDGAATPFGLNERIITPHEAADALIAQSNQLDGYLTDMETAREAGDETAFEEAATAFDNVLATHEEATQLDSLATQTNVAEAGVGVIGGVVVSGAVALVAVPLATGAASLTTAAGAIAGLGATTIKVLSAASSMAVAGSINLAANHVTEPFIDAAGGHLRDDEGNLTDAAIQRSRLAGAPFALLDATGMAAMGHSRSLARYLPGVESKLKHVVLDTYPRWGPPVEDALTRLSSRYIEPAGRAIEEIFDAIPNAAYLIALKQGGEQVIRTGSSLVKRYTRSAVSEWLEQQQNPFAGPAMP